MWTECDILLFVKDFDFILFESQFNTVAVLVLGIILQSPNPLFGFLCSQKSGFLTQMQKDFSPQAIWLQLTLDFLSTPVAAAVAI